MPLKRTPSSSPMKTSASPLQHYHSDTNVSLVSQERDILCDASSLPSKRNVKRKRDLLGQENTDDISKKEWKSMLAEIQKQQDYKLDAILSSITELKVSIDSISAKYDDVLKRIVHLEEERNTYENNTQLLENKIDLLERNAKCTSIEIRNVPQEQRESKEELQRILNSVAKVLNLELQKNEIKNIYRINTKTPTKPIIADFTTVLTRDNFLNSYKKYNKKHLKDKLNTTNLNIAGQKKWVYRYI